MNSKTRYRLDVREGTPTITIDGEATRPLIFFFNTEVPEGAEFLAPQVRLAAAAGVHLYSLCLPWPWPEPGRAPDYSQGERFLQAFLDVDPDARFIVRMRCEGAPEWIDAHPETAIVYADGTRPAMTSLASELWWETLATGLAQAVEHFEASAYGDRILAYHPAGQTSNEWFHFEYWLHGPDYSDANTRAFRQWLTAEYGADEALRHAWNRADVSLGTAVIPARFGIESEPYGAAERPFDVFLNPESDKDRVDFHEYTNSIVAERLIGISQVIKRATNDDKLVLVFYGYFFEMHAADAGHFAMQKILECPSIDLMASPLSYVDRQAGGAGSFMTAIDSLPLHDKLWIVENDYRTDCLRVDRLPEWITEAGLGPRAQSREETLAVIGREYGAMQTHRCGTWWMDLIAMGAFNDEVVWRDIGDRLAPLYDGILEQPTAYTPELGLIVDERAMHFLRAPAVEGQACYNPVYDLACRHGRDTFGRSGVTWGCYYLADFLSGRAPACRAYWFLNLYAVTDGLTRAIHRRLKETGATALWQYAPGWITEHSGLASTSLEAAQRLTGLSLAVDSGAMGSRGVGPLAGLEWGDGAFLNPRIAVEDSGATTLARYASGDAVSAAVKSVEHGQSVFVGDASLTPGMACALFDSLGLHTWVRDGGVVHTDGRHLFVHYGESGERTIHLPADLIARDGERAHTGSFTLTFTQPETRVFRLERKAGVSR